MADLKPLPAEIDEIIGDLADKTADARDAGDFDTMMRLNDESWNALPEPRTAWEFEPQSIARGAVEDIAETGAGAAMLDTWLERMHAAYFDPGQDNIELNLIAGTALMRVGRDAEAVARFKKVYAASGPRWFKGEYRRYLELAEK